MIKLLWKENKNVKIKIYNKFYEQFTSNGMYNGHRLNYLVYNTDSYFIN